LRLFERWKSNRNFDERSGYQSVFRVRIGKLATNRIEAPNEPEFEIDGSGLTNNK
jgi:hypothetical protein